MNRNCPMLPVTALALCLLLACSARASGAYDAVVVRGPALNGTSSDSVAHILSDRYGWRVGVLKLGDLGRYDFTDVKLLYFPGGKYLNIHLPPNGKANIRHAVSQGMGWIGSCAGSLIAAEYTQSGGAIGLFPGLQRYGSIRGNRTFSFDVKHPIVANSRAAGRITAELEMHVNEGPSDYILNKLAEAGVKKWVVARHKEGKRRPAVVAVLFGKGRVLITAAHPERPQYMPAEIAKAPQVIEMAAEWCAGMSDPQDNKPPAVQMEAPASGTPRKTLYFSAVGSKDPEGYPLGFIWDFGHDTPQAMTPLAWHSYNKPGVYTVTLTVTDGRQHTIKQQRVSISGDVEDSPPSVTFLKPFRGNHLSGKVAVAVRAFDRDEGGADGDGIREVKVGLLRDGEAVLEKELQAAPYVWQADLSEVPDGKYKLRATAVSSGKGSTESTATIGITIGSTNQLAQPFTGMSRRRPRSRPGRTRRADPPADAP